jgi:hypothetical protein
MIAIVVWSSLVEPLAAQPGIGRVPEPIPIRKLSITPAREPEPSMRWRLLPEVRDTTPGNAVVLYYRAFSPEWLSFYRRDAKTPEALNAAMTMPISDLKTLAADPSGPIGWIENAPLLKELDRAARRQYCDWDLVTRAREEGIGMLLPDIQSFRMFAPMLAVRARLELADGDFNKAERSLQTGIAFGRHLGDSPTLIQSLVAAAVTTVMLDQVEQWVRTPNSPNLYWALTNLPQPFVDLRKAYESERMLIDNLLPGFREALAKRSAEPLTPSAIAALQVKLVQLPDQNLSLVATFFVMKKYAQAKEYLQTHGWSAENVEALPAVQAVLLAEVATYDRLYDEMIKWVGVPYPLAHAGLDKADHILRREIVSSGSPSFSLAGLLIPATIKVMETSNRLDRRIAALRAVEAIRIFAAIHGRLPTSLSEITEVPVPVNPATGAAFAYVSDGATATLSVAAESTRPQAAWNSFQYEITIRK